MKPIFRSVLPLFASVIMALPVFGQPQQKQTSSKNWQNKSIETDSVYGTGSDQALALLNAAGLKPQKVLVAVIDGGVYINHPDLKDHIWTNPKEIPNNHIDDDKNGYVDDVHGWDFIGGKDSDINHENQEITRVYRDLSKKYANANPAQMSKADKKEYNNYLKIKSEFETKRGTYEMQVKMLDKMVDGINKMKTAMGNKNFNAEQLKAYNPPADDSDLIKDKNRLSMTFQMLSLYMPNVTADSLKVQLNEGVKQLNNYLLYDFNPDFNPRYIVGDNYADVTQRNYGNNDVVGPTDLHGTHVSGIIAGDRTGKAGAQEGIADDAVIMAVRAVPDGDERDKDVANAIRYAVDNGARVVNMSFGKPFGTNKDAVDDAVKYAEAHDVLLVHAAGNDHKDNDTTNNFPNRRFAGSHKQADNWLEVGASDIHGNPGSFSNYGKKSVDLFSPGVKIYSTLPDTIFGYESGTSMASPCAAGVACILREYFPSLSAKDIRKILMKSVTKITFKVPMPGNGGLMVNYSDLCISGGIINATKAVELALKKTGSKYHIVNPKKA